MVLYGSFRRSNRKTNEDAGDQLINAMLMLAPTPFSYRLHYIISSPSVLSLV